MKPESFELYNKSGVRRTIRLKAWGFAKRGTLNGISLFDSHKSALYWRKPGEKIIAVEVTIKAAPTRKKG